MDKLLDNDCYSGGLQLQILVHSILLSNHRRNSAFEPLNFLETPNGLFDVWVPYKKKFFVRKNLASIVELNLSQAFWQYSKFQFHMHM
jgi:hypothetical protein